MKAFILVSLLSLTFSALATDLPVDHTAAEAHAEKARAVNATTQSTREPAQASGQHPNDYAVRGGGH